MLRKTVYFAIFWALVGSSQADLTLTVNTAAETVSWSAEETSGNITTTGFVFGVDIIVATAFTPNPTGPTPYVQMGSDGLLMTSHTTTIVNGGVSPGASRLYVDGNNELLSVIVANIVDFDGGPGNQTTVTATGNFSSYDYGSVGLSGAQLGTLERMDGMQLNFYRVDDPFAVLGVAGTVEVIPEPAPVLLVGLCLSVMALRRRR